MDLLALASSDGQLCLHRLNWQRLWAVTPEPPATALCWRPDGMALAVGHQDGTVSILDAENGESLNQGKMVTGRVDSIGWVEEEAPVKPPDSVQQPLRANKFCPNPAPYQAHLSATLPEVYLAGSSAAHQQIIDRGAWPAQSPKLDLLCVSHGSALSVCTWGLFPVAGLDIMPVAGVAPGKPAPVTIVKATVSKDLRLLYILWTALDGADKQIGRVHVTICNTALLSQRRRELHSLSHLAKQTMTCLSVPAAVQTLRSILRNNGLASSPQKECVQLLVSGSISVAMHQFLTTSSLGEAGLKKLSKAVDGYVQHVGVQLADHVQPALQAACFTLGELMGLARCTRWLQPLGLQAAQIEQVLEAVSQMLVRLEALRIAVTVAGGQYRQFFAWLLRNIRKLNEDNAAGEAAIKVDAVAVADFLQGQFQQDCIQPELDFQAFCDGRPWPASRLPRVQQAGSDVAALAQLLQSHPAAATEDTLRCQLKRAQMLCSNAFSGSPRAISPQILPICTMQVAPQVSAAPMAASVAMALAQAKGEARDNVARICCVAHRGQQRLLVLARVAQETHGDTPATQAANSASASVSGTLLQPPAGEQIIDVAFYRDGHLAILLAAQQRTGAGVCLQRKVVHQLPSNIRGRVLPHSQAQFPLALSAPRGVCCVLSNTQRAILYDLEEDEGPEGEDSEEEPQMDED
eukprot:jgi/Astpho2/844/fgenesh1_pg.00016_%23_68_t